jgi:hypothetical protein
LALVSFLLLQPDTLVVFSLASKSIFASYISRRITINQFLVICQTLGLRYHILFPLYQTNLEITTRPSITMKTAIVASALLWALPMATANFVLQAAGGTPVDGEYITWAFTDDLQLTVVSDQSNATVHDIDSNGHLVDVSTGNYVGQTQGGSPNEMNLLYTDSATPLTATTNANNEVTFSQSSDSGYYLQWFELALNPYSTWVPNRSYPGWVTFAVYEPSLDGYVYNLTLNVINV